MPFGLGTIGLAVLLGLLLPPLLIVGLAIGLGVVILGAGVITYFRIRAWARQKLGRRRDDSNYKAEVLHVGDDEDDSDNGEQSDRPRRTVEVHRRPRN